MSSRPVPGLLPWFACFAVFGLIPLLAALVLSFYSMNPLRPDLTHWIGASNYARAIGSPAFWHALRTTGIFVVGTLPVTLILSYIVAALLGRLRRGEALFRAAIFFPALYIGNWWGDRCFDSSSAATYRRVALGILFEGRGGNHGRQAR